MYIYICLYIYTYIYIYIYIYIHIYIVYTPPHLLGHYLFGRKTRLRGPLWSRGACGDSDLFRRTAKHSVCRRSARLGTRQPSQVC